MADPAAVAGGVLYGIEKAIEGNPIYVLTLVSDTG